MTMFDYDSAFSRNIGWLTPAEQRLLRGKRVAIGGLGGVGGHHLLTLTRLGVGAFHLADFDRFEVHNFNRQSGAFVSTLGSPKIETMLKMARDINPEIDVRCFPAGVQTHDVEDFLSGCDLYVDGIDFFALDIRIQLFKACRAMAIPALTAAPLGMGSAMLYFDPRGMSFDDYFRLDGCDRTERFARFIAGLSPAMLQRHYLAVPESVNFAAQRGPSTVMACDLCAGMLGTAALKIMLRRGQVRAAPWSSHFDAYTMQFRNVWRPFGNKNPLQWLLLRLLRPRLALE